ncbi:MAG: hypothetical protein IKW57_03695 [Alphaproteobacteria bacterium]|nr:hypothetical protein [Alphaproteobacteria bacterium]
MKKIISLAVLAAVTATAVNAAPSHLVRNSNGGYTVNYDYYDKEKTGWYIGGRASLSLLNWKNEYETAAPNGFMLEDESYTEVVFGANMFAGRRLNYFWRAEVEGGLIGQHEHDDVGTTFKITIPYVVANAYYDFANGFYAGAGLGVALPTVKWYGADFVGGEDKESSVSPMGALMFGYAHKLDYNLWLDLRYRLSMLSGPEHKRSFQYVEPPYDEYDISNKVGLILDNSISVGLRYEF